MLENIDRNALPVSSHASLDVLGDASHSLPPGIPRDIRTHLIPDEKDLCGNFLTSYTCTRLHVIPWDVPSSYEIPVAPVAYQVILEPGIGQFREFESPRVHTRINS